MAKETETKTKQAPPESTRTGRPRAVREPRMMTPTEDVSGKSGRPPRKKADLTVRREGVSAVTERKPEPEIIRIHTGVDRVMLALIVILLVLGAIMVFSASYPEALAQKEDSMHYIKKHMIWMGLGTVFLIVASLVPIWLYKWAAPYAYGVAIVLLIIVLIPGVGISNGEARRWLGFGEATFQPSEIMKVALVMILAWYLDKKRELVLDRSAKGKTFLYAGLYPCLFVGAACGLVLAEKHLSGTIILGLIALFVLVVGGAHLGWVGLLATAFGVVGGGGFLLLNPYAQQRLSTFFDKNADKLDEAWQTTQGLLAIGSGGFLGVGLGASNQKHSYVSEAQNDFIFAIFCEEMGFVGAVALIILFLLFIWRGYLIALRAPDIFSCLLVFGIISQVGIQALLNIGVVTDVLPNTGVPLPFFSYGGTSLIILMAEMGVVLSVSKHSYLKK
ncbi:MAG: putative lipid II flippase FtsW [Clostridia bacterium]|nr:putative lipid II flippase FtsW [Clostridia bacterium]